MWVAERIQDGHAGKKRAWRDFAILYRTNAQSRVFEDIFLSYRIPYRIIGGLRFYERAEIKDIVAYLRLAFNASDSVSVRRVINAPARGVGNTSLGRLEDYAGRNNLSLFQACERVEEVSGIGAKPKAGVRAFVDVVHGLQRDAQTMPVHDLTGKAMETSGYVAMLRADRTSEGEARVENLMELLTATQEFEQRSEDKSLQAFLEGVSLMRDLDAAEEGENAVVLMTLHSAKGLEFPVVFLVGLEEGIFPHSRSLDKPEDLEEERRLAYVGITRAREELFLTYAHSRHFFGTAQMNPVSRFIAEIPANVVDDRRVSHAAAAPWSGAARPGPSLWEQMQKRNVTGPAPKRSDLVTPAPAYKVGQKVRHVKFGVGVVVSQKGSGDEAQVSVAFPEAGIKKLLLAYAKLEKV
jgi:DNA helicase-2/ATP-dependent DNA helicase PcrA